jgi:hypothetical protein
MVSYLLCVVGARLWVRAINAQSRGSEAHIQEIFASGEMEGAGLRGEAGALRQEVGHIFGGEGLIDKGIVQGPRHQRRVVNVAQGHDFAHVVRWLEAPLLQLEVIRLGPRRAREKAHEALVIAGFFALFHEWLGMIGGFDSWVPLVTSGMAGHELVTPRDTQASGRGFQHQGVARIGGRDRIAVGIDGNATLPGGADLGHSGHIEGMPRQGTPRRPLGVP